MEPLVAVPGYARLGPDQVSGWRHGGVGAPARYLDALHRAGAREAIFEPVALSDAAAATLVLRFDGVLLLGGGDPDPARYGATARPEVYGVDPGRDACELALVRAAHRAGVPVLAVCRGHQITNVAFGGSLLQHITDAPGLGDHGRPGVGGRASVHRISVEPVSRLADALGTTEVVGSCHHHQAVDRVADGLRVTARADDGVVEAIEPADPFAPWLVGVQWHPEDRAGEPDPDGRTNQALFTAFVEECRRRRPGPPAQE